ncbi:MAG: phage tail tape measure protein [Bacteroidota bacterium]|nr:phage tail tape measure protein [Bacteroidota bacterium]
MDEDTIKLGLELGFDVNDTNIVSKLMAKVKELDNQIKKSVNGVTNLNGELGKLEKTINSIDEKGIRKTSDQFKDSEGIITQVNKVLNKQNEILHEIVTTIDNKAKREKEALNAEIKADQDLTKQLTYEYNVRKKLADMQNKQNNPAQRPGPSFIKDIQTAIEKTVSWASAMTVVYGTLRAIQAGFALIVNIESEMTSIKKVLPNGADIEGLQRGAMAISEGLGSSLGDTLKAAQSWSRQFKDVNDVLRMTQASMLGVAVTDITLESSFKNLSAILAQFKLDTSSAMHITDSLNEMSNNFRASAEDVSVGLTKVGSAAKNMGIDVDRAMALVTVGVETVGTTGSQMGTVLNRAFARVHTKSAVEELKKLGIDAFQPLSKTLDQLGLKWNSLTKIQQENVSKALGGSFHYQKLMTLFSSYNRVIEATVLSYNSMGSAQREAETALNTFNKKFEQLKASIQSFVVTTGNAGVLQVIKAAVDGLRTIVGWINSANQATHGILGMLALVTAGVWGLATAWKAVSLSEDASLIGRLAKITLAIVTVATAIGALDQQSNKLELMNTRLGKFEDAVSATKERTSQAKYLVSIYEQLGSKLQTMNTKSKDYLETMNTYKKVQESLNGLLRDNKMQVEQGLLPLRDKEKQKLQDLIDKIREKERISQQHYNNEIRRQMKALDGDKKQLDVLMKYKGEYWGANKNIKRDWFGGEDGKPEDLRNLNNIRTKVQDWISTNPNMSFGEKFKMSAWATADMTGFLKAMADRSMDLNNQYNNLSLKLDKSTLALALGQSGDDDSGSGGITTEVDKTLKELGKLTQEQAKWVMAETKRIDKDHPPSSKDVKDITLGYWENGLLAKKDFQFQGSSDALNTAKNELTEFMQSLRELPSAFKSVIDSSNSLIESFSKIKFDSLVDWEIGYKKAMNGLVRPKGDIEQQIESLFTNIESINKDYTDKLQKQIEERRSWINKADEQQGQNNKYIQDTLNPLLANMNSANPTPIDQDIKNGLIAALKGFNVEVTDITSGTVKQLISLIQAKNSELERLKFAQNMDIMGLSTTGLANQLLSKTDLDQLQSIVNNSTNGLDNLLSNYIAAKNNMEFTQPKQGSYAEFYAKRDINNANLAYQSGIQSSIDELTGYRNNLLRPDNGLFTTDAEKQKAQSLANNIDAFITLLNQVMQKGIKDLQANVDPWQAIKDKYKFTNSSDYDDMAKALGQGSGSNLLTKIGMSYGKSVDQLQAMVREQIAVLLESVPGTDEYNAKLVEIEHTLSQIDTMNITEQVGGAFKAILKGTKSFKEAIVDMFSEMRDNNVDKFIDNWSKTFTSLMDFNDSSSFKETIGNVFQSLAETWKEMSKNQKFQLALSAGSLFIKNNGSRQSAQENGIVQGASAGFSVGGPWGAVIGGVLGFLGGNKQYKQQKKQNNTNLRSSIMDSMTTDTFQAYNDFLSAGTAGFGYTTKKHTLAGITSIFGTDKEKLHRVSIDEVIKKWKELFENGGIYKLINSTNTYLLQTLEKWSKYLDSLEASVSNIASNLENAFAAKNYVDFLQSWGTSLEDMTRTALIRGFMAQSSFQGLYRNLSNTIGMAVLDGVLNPDEIASIKEQGSIISGQMRTLYQSLALVDNMYPDTNTSSGNNQSYTAGSSIPIVYNNYVNLYCQAFMGDRDDARTFAMMVRDEIVAEEARG